MSKAHEQHGEEKKHGDTLDKATHSPGEQNSASDRSKGNAIPEADNGGHARSAAAHLKESEHLHGNAAKGDANYKTLSHSNALREPPQEVTRTGKDHRGQ